ncbi:hypothetical protein VaNZ11_007881, partial [Volvox africanus]
MTPLPHSACCVLQKHFILQNRLAFRDGRLSFGAISGLLSCDSAPYSIQATRKENIETECSSGELGPRPAATKAAHGAEEHPTAVLRQIFERLPLYPTPSTLQRVRRWLEESGLVANIPAPIIAVSGRTTSRITPDSEAILAYVTGLLQPSVSHPVDRHWARASLPELLLLLSRLRIPSHAKLETVLTLILRRGKLPTPGLHAWQKLHRVAGSTEGGDAGRESGDFPPLLPQLPFPALLPPLPTAFRLAQAMACLQVRSHEAWQQLADRHILSRPGQLLDHLTPDQITLLAAAFARAGYHPVQLFRSIADRLLPVVSELQPGSLARALHAFAILRHSDPQLTVALSHEVHCRTAGGGGYGASATSTPISASRSIAPGAAGGGGSVIIGSSTVGSGGSFLSRAGAALFGGNGGGRPDRAHRAPQFLIEDLVRLAEAAVQLGAGESAVRGQVGNGGGGTYGDGLGEQLLAVVAEEAEVAVTARMKVVLVAAPAPVPSEVPPADPDVPPPRVGPGEGPYDVGEAGGGGWGPRGSAAAGVYGELANVGPKFESEVSEQGLYDDSRELPAACTGSSSCSSDSVGHDGDGICSLAAEQLKPVLALLEALAVGGGAAAGGAAARAAHAIASRQLVPKLASLEPYMSPRHFVALLAALLPGPGAAALKQSAHPYPGPLPPQRCSSTSAVVASSSRRASALDGMGRSEKSRGESASPADQLTAVVKALCRRTDPRVFRSARCLLEAWHVLAAARAGGAEGTDDPRVTAQLMAPVFACVVRHVAMMGSAPEAARFIVSCALLSVYDKAALNAIAAPLVAALGGGGSRQPSHQHVGAGVRGGGIGTGGSMTRCRTTALAPSALAQLGWAVGQLGFAHSDLLAAIQNQALVLSTPSLSLNASLEPYSQWQPLYDTAVVGDDLRRGSGASPLAVAPAAATTAAAAAAAGLSSPPLLGPLELADVMWGLSVNQYRSQQGADIRQLYLRAASQGVVSIDDPRWLRLVHVHLLFLLGWAGGLGEAAAGQLRSGWFNALGYAWERQAVARKEHLAGSTGLPTDPDPAASTFRHGVTAAVRDLLRGGGIQVEGSGSGGGGGRRRGEWRLQPGFVWRM